MKVVFVTIGYPPLSGGLAADVKGVVELTNKLGYKTTVITAEHNKSIKTEGLLEQNVTRLSTFAWIKDSPIINPYELYRTLTNDNADIVHIVYPFPIGLDIACLYARVNHKKLVCSYVDDVVVKFPFSFLIKAYENTSWRIVKKTIDSISVLSKEYGNHCAGLMDWEKKLYEIPPPVFDTNFDLTLSMKYEARDFLHLNGFNHIVLFVGSLRKRTFYKRLDLLLKAWAEYTKISQNKSILLIIGDGELKNYYKEAAKTLGIGGDNIRFLGFVPRETLIKCYLAGDVLVLPSEDNNEAFGIVAVESMLYGNIVIGSDIPGIRGAIRKSEQCHASLVRPKLWEPIVIELQKWLSKDLKKLELENHLYIKNIYNIGIIKQRLAEMYNGDINTAN